MTSGNSHIQDEMREVEEELEEDSSLHDTQNARGTTIPLEALEEGKSHSRHDSSSIPSSPRRASSSSAHRSNSPRPRSGPSINFPLSNAMGGSNGKKKSKGTFERIKDGVRGGLQVLVNPVFAQAFVLTFLGEWGDRSQITTIAMGAAHVS